MYPFGNYYMVFFQKYFLIQMHRGMEKKLLNELTGKLVHYGHHFHPNNLEKENSFIVNGTMVSVYTR